MKRPLDSLHYPQIVVGLTTVKLKGMGGEGDQAYLGCKGDGRQG